MQISNRLIICAGMYMCVRMQCTVLQAFCKALPNSACLSRCKLQVASVYDFYFISSICLHACVSVFRCESAFITFVYILVWRYTSLTRQLTAMRSDLMSSRATWLAASHVTRSHFKYVIVGIAYGSVFILWPCISN